MAKLRWETKGIHEHAQGVKVRFQIGRTAMHPNGSQWVAANGAGFYLTAYENGGVVFFEHLDTIDQAKKRAEELEFAHTLEGKQ